MVDVLHLGMAVPAAVGLCCTVGDRHRRTLSEVLPAIVMALAMSDLAQAALLHRTAVLPALIWAVLLLGLSALPAAAHRRQSGAALTRIGAAMVAHRGLGIVTMAALMLAMSAHSVDLASPAAEAHTHSGQILTVVAMVGVGALVGLTGWLLWQLWSGRQVLAGRRAGGFLLADTLCMAISVATMATAMIF